MWLGDIIDISLWKEIQSHLAIALSCRLLAVDINGKIVSESERSPALVELIDYRKSMQKSGFLKELIYEVTQNASVKELIAPSGFRAIAAPLFLNTQIVGAIVCYPFVEEGELVPVKEIAVDINVSVSELESMLSGLPRYSLQHKAFILRSLQWLPRVLLKLMQKKQQSDVKFNQLKVIGDVTRAINRSIELQKILKEILGAFEKFVEGSFASVTLTDYRRYALGDLADLRFADQVFLHQLRDSHIKTFIKEIEDDFRLKHLDLSRRRGLSCLVLPLLSQDKLIGIVSIYADNDDFSPKLVELLEVLADQAATAVDHARQYEEMRRLATTDALTGLYNRVYFVQRLDQSIARCREKKKPLSLALFDVDDFRHYNNTNGHPAGDRLLKELSKLLQDGTSGSQFIARYGGEEFVAVLPELKSNEAIEFLECMRKAVANYPFFNREKQPGGMVSMSMGLVVCQDASLNTQELLDKADKALYDAKKQGKNKLCTTIFIHKSLSEVNIN